MKTYIVITTWTTVIAAAWLTVFGFPTLWLALSGLLILLLIFAYQAGSPTLKDKETKK